MQKCVGAVDGRAAGRTAELGDGYLPGVGPETELVDQPGGQRRHAEAGARHIDDGVDVTGGEVGVAQGLLDDRRGPPLGLGLVDTVALRQARVLEGLLDRLDDMPLQHSGVPDQPERQGKLRLSRMGFRGELESLFDRDDVFRRAHRGLA